VFTVEFPLLLTQFGLQLTTSSCRILWIQFKLAVPRRTAQKWEIPLKALDEIDIAHLDDVDIAQLPASAEQFHGRAQLFRCA
jgi:hypothetical protein